MKANRPKILLCNDDGIRAPGIRHLWKALKAADFADITIIAPAHEKSGAGVSITWDRPMLIQKYNWEDDPETPAWSVDGSPADCIKMGMKIIMQTPPDIILSGINAGSNAGRNVLHSGTVGAVIEGVFRNIPGIAFSCENGRTPNFEVAEKYIVPITQYIMQKPLEAGSFLNVNIPQCCDHEVKGFRFTRQGKGRWLEDPILHLDNDKGKSYWLGGKPEELAEDDDCDIALLRQGYLTAVPIQVFDLTNIDEWQNRRSSFESIFQKTQPTLNATAAS